MSCDKRKQFAKKYEENIKVFSIFQELYISFNALFPFEFHDTQKMTKYEWKH